MLVRFIDNLHVRHNHAPQTRGLGYSFSVMLDVNGKGIFRDKRSPRNSIIFGNVRCREAALSVTANRGPLHIPSNSQRLQRLISLCFMCEDNVPLIYNYDSCNGDETVQAGLAWWEGTGPRWQAGSGAGASLATQRTLV